MVGRTSSRVHLAQSAKLLSSSRVISFVQYCALPAEELAARIVEDAATNPEIDVKFKLSDPKPQSWRPAQLSKSAQALLGLTSSGPSLDEHVRQQIGWLVPNAKNRRIAIAWLEHLDPSGWVTIEVSEIARQTGSTEADAESVLKLLQNAEPSGLFSRTLSECLGLQLAAQDKLTKPMIALLLNLQMLADGELSELANACSVDQSELPKMISTIRNLNPKPGADFSAEAPLPPSPDFLLHRDDNGMWQLERGSFIQPKLKLKDLPKANLQSQAQKTIRSYDDREALMFKTASAALEHQAAFLDGLVPYPSVLTAAQLAKDLGVHETTIGRIRKHLTIGTEVGQVRLNTLFFRGIGQGPIGPVSAPELQWRIEQITKQSSLKTSDQEIADRLSQLGLVVARRTIAKHRQLIS